MKYLIIFIFILSACDRADRPLHIMVIGDSNGASDHGWVIQLKKLLPEDSIYNYSVSGNTIGFDNLGQERLNTLRKIDDYLTDVNTRTEQLDRIILLLGTNDCKAVFSTRKDEVPVNLNALLQRLQSDEWLNRSGTRVMLVSPPPVGPDEKLTTKYRGGSQCVKRLTTEYERIARRRGVLFVNVHHELEPVFMELSKDGVHLNRKGQLMMAKMISDNL